MINYYTPICYVKRQSGVFEKLTFSKYVIDDNGLVYSLNYNHSNKMKECVGSVDKDGYVMLCLRCDNGKRENIRRCRISASTFIGEPPEKDSQVNHKDEVKTNDNPSNIEWCDSTFNNNYGNRNEHISSALKGRKPNPSICKPVRVWKYIGEFQSIADAARELGIEKNAPNISTTMKSGAKQTLVKGYLFEKIL